MLIQDLQTGKYAGPWSLETFNPAYWKEDAAAVARRGFDKVIGLFTAS
jgi:hypothetical protein